MIFFHPILPRWGSFSGDGKKMGTTLDHHGGAKGWKIILYWIRSGTLRVVGKLSDPLPKVIHAYEKWAYQKSVGTICVQAPLLTLRKMCLSFPTSQKVIQIMPSSNSYLYDTKLICAKMRLIQFDGKLEREKGRFWQMGAYHKSVETHGIFGTLLGNKRLRKKQRLWVVGVCHICRLSLSNW